MARPLSRFPTEMELQILKILWRGGPLSVREVRDALADDAGRDLAHTTVVTTLNTMTSKRYVKRRQEGKSYVFEARIAEGQVSRGMLADLVDRVFDGSAVSLLLNLIESERIDAEEYETLRRIIAQKAKGQEP